MDRLLSRFDSGFSLPSIGRIFGAMPMWQGETFFGANAPVVDICEDDKTYKVTAELPGLDDKNLAVSLANHCLVIKGEKRREKEEKDKNHYLSERSYGSFERSFSLPDGIDEDKVEAHFSKVY